MSRAKKTNITLLIFGIEITIFGKKSQPTKSMFIAPGFWVDLRILICTCTVYALILTGAFKDEVKHVDTTLLKENLCDLVGDSQMRFINPFALFNELSISILLQILCPHDDDGDDDVDDRLVSIPSEWKERWRSIVQIQPVGPFVAGGFLVHWMSRVWPRL